MNLILLYIELNLIILNKILIKTNNKLNINVLKKKN